MSYCFWVLSHEKKDLLIASRTIDRTFNVHTLKLLYSIIGEQGREGKREGRGGEALKRDVSVQCLGIIH